MLGSSTSRALFLLGIASTALAWPGRKRPEAAPVPAPAPAPVDEVFPPLFPDALPMDLGPLPSGLANLSAQGCSACHHEAHAQWRDSAHAGAGTGPTRAPRTAEGVDPACRGCHRPLRIQHPDLAPRDYSVTLRTEGVTCAVCHVRDGHVLAAREVEGAPHATRRHPGLRSADLCGACHQLAAPGRPTPIDDTWGEWQRSPQGQAGITCQDCHMASPWGGGPSHGWDVPGSEPVSLLVDASPGSLVPGGPSLRVELRLQNTGAGHAFPTGHPDRAVLLEAWLEGTPFEGEGDPLRVSAFTTELALRLEDQPPWALVADTRLQAGGERVWIWEPTLGLEDRAERWDLVVRLSRRRPEDLLVSLLTEQRVPLEVRPAP